MTKKQKVKETQLQVLAKFYQLRTVEKLNIQEAIAEILSDQVYSEEVVYNTLRDSKLPSRSNVFKAKELLTRISNKEIKEEEELNVFGFMILTYGSKGEIVMSTFRQFEEYLRRIGCPARDENNRRKYYQKKQLLSMWRNFQNEIQ